MPDAARLVAALSLALIAFIVSGLIMPLMPEGTNFGWFTYVNIVLGILCGWIVMGRRAGRGTTAAINNGLTGVAALVFWGLFVQGGCDNVRAGNLRREGVPLEAFSAIFEIVLYMRESIFVPTVVLTLLAGAVLAGLATEYAWRTWR